jgi:hypothetical protein
VCEKCYHVYKELDRLRQHGFKQDMKSKEGIALQAKESGRSYGENMDKANRYTNQTLHDMRLAEAKVRIDKDQQQQSYGENNSFMSKEGAPKGMLPPVPWQLNRQDLAAEYQQHTGGSSFVRNIGAKAKHNMSLLADQQENYEFSQQSLEEADVLNPNYDWKKNLQHGMVKSTSAGNVRQSARKGKKDNTRGFNSDRLLHPHQRYLASMKREQNPTESVEDAAHYHAAVRVKGGAKRKMLSRKRVTSLLPPLAQSVTGSTTSFDAAAAQRSTSPITYSYVQNKLNYPSSSSLQSVKSAKNVSFSSSPSIRNIPNRGDNICESEDEDDDEDDEDGDEIGMLVSVWRAIVHDFVDIIVSFVLT